MPKAHRRTRNGQGLIPVALCISLVLAVAFANPAMAAPGALDPTFNGTGIVTTSFGTYNAGVRSIAIQPNGYIVVAGQTESANADAFALARYDTTGALDPGFNGTGTVTTSIGPSFDGANAVALQSNGRIVAAGFAVMGNGIRFALARYLPNGTLDPSFGGNGKVTTPFGSGGSTVSSISIQPDGRIVAAGEALVGNTTRFALARYMPNGALDASFGGNGKVTTSFGAGGRASSVAIQPADGRIVAAGTAPFGGVNRFAVARYKTNGSLDPTFGSTGKVSTSIGSADAGASALAIQLDGKLVTAGQAVNAGNKPVFALARYNGNGSLNTGFNNTGKQTTLINSDAGAYAVALRPTVGTKIVVAGRTFNGSYDDFALARYASNGSPDPSFNVNGTTTATMGSDFAAYAVAIQSDGQIVAAGMAYNGNNYDFAIARFDG